MGLGVGAGAAVAAAVAGGVASAGATALISSATTKKQSGAISTGQTQANQVLQPYVDTGTNALAKYADISGANGSDAATKAQADFVQSPGYQWQFDQGIRAVDAGAAAKGMLRSGATIKGEEAYGQGLAKQDFGSYVARLNDLANFGIKGAGLQAGTDTSAAGQQSSIAAQQGNALNSAIGTGTGAVTNALTKYFNSPGSGPTSTVYNQDGTFPSASNPNAIVPGYQADNFTPISSLGGNY